MGCLLKTPLLWAGVYQLEVSYTSGWIGSLNERIKREPISIDLVHDRKVSYHAASKAQHVYEAKTLEVKNPIPLRMISHITEMKIVKVDERIGELNHRTWMSSLPMTLSLETFSEYLEIKRVKGESGLENFILEMFLYGINEDKEKEAEKSYYLH